MIVSICRRIPGHRTLSIHAHDLVFDDKYEKEKVPLNEGSVYFMYITIERDIY
jgi:hypothetical protein